MNFSWTVRIPIIQSGFDEVLCQGGARTVGPRINADRISTFMAKIQATHMLLLQIRDGHEDAGFWTAADLPGYPRRQRSAEQQAVLTWVPESLTISDAAERRNRILQVSGSPGTGKTEVVIAAAKLALDDDCGCSLPDLLDCWSPCIACGSLPMTA